MTAYLQGNIQARGLVLKLIISAWLCSPDNIIFFFAPNGLLVSVLDKAAELMFTKVYWVILL